MLSGCLNRIDRTLPENPIHFEWKEVSQFLRAVDTKGKKIERYSFMDSPAYIGSDSFWGEEQGD